MSRPVHVIGRWPILGLAVVCAATVPSFADGDGPGKSDAAPVASKTAMVPLTDMRKATYLGFAGGLYPDGSNEPPKAHADEGKRRAANMKPLDAAGKPDPGGKLVLLSIGMSNTTQEFYGGAGPNPARASFMGQAREDDAVEKRALVIANGAAGGKVAQAWAAPTLPDYDRVRDGPLRTLGVSERQVVAVWLKVADPQPKVSLPDPRADAHVLLGHMGKIARALKVRYPNLQQVFLSSRIHAGYATTPLNPEPYAYESGFAVKWLIEAQIEQKKTGKVDERAGDLDYDSAAPWLAWGPYLWTSGTTARADGLVWAREDCGPDGTHPSPSGVKKVGKLLLDFFKSSPFTPWFRL